MPHPDTRFSWPVIVGTLAFLSATPGQSQTVPPAIAADLAAVPKKELSTVSGWVNTVLASAEAKGPTHADTRALLAKIVPLGLRNDPEEDEAVGGPIWQPSRLDVVFGLCDHCVGREDPLTQECLQKLITHPVLIPIRQQAHGLASDAALSMMMAVAYRAHLAYRAQPPEHVLLPTTQAVTIVCRSPLYRHPSNRVSATKLSLLWRAPAPAQQFAVSKPDLFKDEVKAAEAKQGPDHPKTLAALDHWALYLSVAGDTTAAAGHLKRIVDARSKALGPQHPDTLTAIDNLGWCLYAAGDLAKAAPLLQQALTGRQQALPADHPDLILSQEHHAGLQDSMGDRAAALASFQAVLGAREKALGTSHPLAIKSLVNLADFHFANGELDLAEPLYLKAKKVRETTLGPTHADTLSSQDDLAELLLARKDLPKAKEALLQAAAARNNSAHGSPYAKCAILTHLGALLCMQGDFVEAESKLQTARGWGMPSAISSLPLSYHPALARTSYWTAVADRGMGSEYRSSAIECAAEAVEGLTKFLGPAHPWTKEAQALSAELATQPTHGK